VLRSFVSQRVTSKDRSATIVEHVQSCVLGGGSLLVWVCHRSVRRQHPGLVSA
jgi:hypothetical protein